LSVVSAYFTIYAYEALSAELDRIGKLRFLYGEPRFIAAIEHAILGSSNFTDASKQVKHASDFELIAWLVIK
jgi:hypothetical protein